MDLPTHTKADLHTKFCLGQVANECENYISDKWTSLKAGTRIAGAAAEGACEEIKDRPLTVLGYAAVGAATAAGVACLSPEVAVCAGAAGAMLLGFELSQDMPKWCHEAVVVGNEGRVSKSEYTAAHNGLESLGAHGLDLAAASLGGTATSSVARVELRCLADSLGRRDLGVMRTAGGFLSRLYSKLDSIGDSDTEKALYSGSSNLILGAEIGRGAVKKQLEEPKKPQH